MPPGPATSPKPEPPARWNPGVIAAVGVVCTICLLLSYYRILKRHCCALGGVNSRNQAQGRLLNEAIPDDPSLQFHSRGLDSIVMHSIPITQFKKKSGEELSQSSTECAVCLGEFEEGEWLKHLPNCSHSFHVACIDTWFQSHSNCPLCRSHVYDITADHEFSMYNLLQSLRREDFLRERASHYQMLRAEILQNSALQWEAANVN